VKSQIDVFELKKEFYRHIERERNSSMYKIGFRIANMIYELMKAKKYSGLQIIDESDDEFVKFRVKSDKIVVFISEENYFWPDVFLAGD